MQSGPARGDVLITTRDGGYYLSVVPYPDRLHFKALDRAIAIARLWAAAEHVEIWRAHDGKITKLRDESAA